MAYNYEYPYTDPTRFNADWILNKIKELTNEMNDFVFLNTIKYADPIIWNITTQYEGNTVVIDGNNGNAYISTQPVPSGIALSNTDYWTLIFNYSNTINTLEEQIAPANEYLSPTASDDRNVGDLVWLNGVLYRITAPMIAGDSYIIGSNCEQTTIEYEIKNTYIPASERLVLHANVDGNAEILAGDIHIYDGNNQAIRILHQ